MGEKGEGRPSWLPTSLIPAVSLRLQLPRYTPISTPLQILTLGNFAVYRSGSQGPLISPNSLPPSKH